MQAKGPNARDSFAPFRFSSRPFDSARIATSSRSAAERSPGIPRPGDTAGPSVQSRGCKSATRSGAEGGARSAPLRTAWRSCDPSTARATGPAQRLPRRGGTPTSATYRHRNRPSRLRSPTSQPLDLLAILRQRPEPGLRAPLVDARRILKLVRLEPAIPLHELRPVALRPPSMHRHAIMEVGKMLPLRLAAPHGSLQQLQAPFLEVDVLVGVLHEQPGVTAALLPHLCDRRPAVALDEVLHPRRVVRVDRLDPVSDLQVDLGAVQERLARLLVDLDAPRELGPHAGPVDDLTRRRAGGSQRRGERRRSPHFFPSSFHDRPGSAVRAVSSPQAIQPGWTTLPDMSVALCNPPAMLTSCAYPSRSSISQARAERPPDLQPKTIFCAGWKWRLTAATKSGFGSMPCEVMNKIGML